MATPIKLMVKALRNLAKTKYKRPSQRWLGSGRNRDNNILALIGLGGSAGVSAAAIAGYANRPEGKPWGQKLAAINRKKKKRRDARREEASRASRQGVEKSRYKYNQQKNMR